MDIYETQWVFITRFSEDLKRSFSSIPVEDELEPIEETVDRAKDAIAGGIVNLIGLNQDLQKVFKELNRSMNAIEGYEGFLKSDMTDLQSMFGENIE